MVSPKPFTLNPLNPEPSLQVDGEPWVQGPSELSVSLRTGAKGLVLRRLPRNSPAARMTALVNEVGLGLGWGRDIAPGAKGLVLR